MIKLLFLMLIIPSLAWPGEIENVIKLAKQEKIVIVSGISDVEIREINWKPDIDQIKLIYRELDSNGVAIPYKSTWVDKAYYIRNTYDNPYTDVNACSGISVPFDPCSGVSIDSPTGVLDETDMAYQDVMSYLTTSGKKIGEVLMDLLWGKLKWKFPKGGKDAVFAK